MVPIASDHLIRLVEAALLSGNLSDAQFHLNLLELGNSPASAAKERLSGFLALADSRVPDAIACFREAVAIEPWQACHYQNLGSALAASGDWQAAADSFANARTRFPSEEGLTLWHARSLASIGEPTAAKDLYLEALQQGASAEEVGFRVASLFVFEREYQSAEELLSASLDTFPESLRSRHLLIQVLGALGQDQHVRQHWEAIVHTNPKDSNAKSNLASLLWDDGELAESLRICRELLDEHTISPSLHSFYLSAIFHEPGQSGSTVRAAHEHWYSLHARSAIRYETYNNQPKPDRRLRLAYIGGDFFDSPSYHFLIPFFRHHDHSNFEVFGFDLRNRQDQAQQEFRSLCDNWRDVSVLTDDEVIRQIRRDEIDILVDTTGHYEGNHVQLFASKPAPLQYTFPNYPGTTGLSLFDGIVTDSWVCPAGTEDQYSEQPLRLDSGYLPYAPPPQALPLTPLPALRNGFITFGLFQRPVKISNVCWESIGSLLRALPTARLLIHNSFPALAEVDSRIRLNFIEQLDLQGVSRARLDFAGPTTMENHLKILASADIALDTFPYNGQTTTCECLWMGVPVVSLTGTYHVSRVGHMLLSRLGLPEWSTASPQDYERLALSLALDLVALSHWRTTLRSLFLASPILDGKTTTQQFENAIRTSWRNWCADQGDHT